MFISLMQMRTKLIEKFNWETEHTSKTMYVLRIRTTMNNEHEYVFSNTRLDDLHLNGLQQFYFGTFL